MATSDLVSLAALLAAFLSVFYARHALVIARKANSLAVHWQQRPLRMEVFCSIWQFANYCSTYSTLINIKAVNGTRDLVARIDRLKWETLQHGPLDMPVVDELTKQMVSAAWNMQRLIDRIAGGHNEPMDAGFESAEAQLQSLIEWFASQRDGLQSTFQPYLLQEAT